MAIKNLTIELGPKDGRLTVASLIVSLEKALAALRGMDKGTEGQWEIVRVRMNSPLRMTVRNPEASRFVPSHLRLLGSLEKKPRMPKSLNSQSLEASRELATVVRQNVSYLKFSYGGEKSVTLTEHFTKNVDIVAKISARYHYEWTTLEGMLSQITVLDEVTRFRIIERRTGRGIECTFLPAMLDRAKEFLPHRVEVDGIAKINAMGEAVSMEVRDFRKMRTRGDLPQFKDLRGINITGGVDSAEYVGRIRNGD